MSLSTPPSRVQKLQASLQAKAKSEPEFRFYSLWDKICREDVLAEAYRRCRANRGAPGTDGETFADIDSFGREPWLRNLREELRAGSYRSAPLLRVWIPKSNGKQRPLGIPTFASYCTSLNMRWESRPAVRFPPQLRLIRDEWQTQSSSSASFSASRVIQYGDPRFILRASITPRSIQ